jgi:hypothetical protein
MKSSIFGINKTQLLTNGAFSYWDDQKFDPKKAQDKDLVLVRMTRANFRYDAMGFTFTDQHPFVAMSEETAQEIFDKEEGFRLATPKEAQDFYN